MKFKELFDVIGKEKLIEVQKGGRVVKAGFKHEMDFSKFNTLDVLSFVSESDEIVIVTVKEGE